jgi:WD40 repeat protein
MKPARQLLSLFLLLLAVLPIAAQGPWSTPEDLGSPVNDTSADFQPAISPDGLSLYVVKFDGINVNNAVMWVFHRATKAEPWGAPEQLPSTINVAGKTKATPFISADGHWMYFASNRLDLPNRGQNDLFRSHRNSTSADSGPDGWQQPMSLGPVVNSTRQEQMGCVFTDDATGVTTLYFNSDRAQHDDLYGGGKGQDIYVSTLQGDGTFGAATPVAELNDLFATQQHPTCSRDGLEMLFSSDRPNSVLYPASGICGPANQPSLDIWVSTRASASGPWGPPEDLDLANLALNGPPINSECHDGRPSLSSDATELYFYSAEFRPGSIPPFFDIWETTRPDAAPPNPPTAHVNPTPNAAGWNNTDVVVSFTPNGDPGHISTGVSDCTADVLLSSDTAGFPVNGTCSDQAGNLSDPSTVTIKLDKAPPVVQITGVSDGASYLLGNIPPPGCSSADALSGLATSATLAVTGGNAYGVGSFTATCSGASDVAGNVAPPLHATYSVGYSFSGFLSPLGASVGEFKLGSTVPIKWQLRDADGTYISRFNSVKSLQVAYDGSCSADDGNALDLGSSGTTGLRYDDSGNQFIFNWQTKGLAAGCYSIFLTLDDTTLHAAMVRLM